MATRMREDPRLDTDETFGDPSGDGLAGLFEPLEQLSPSTYLGATLGSIALSLALYAGGRKDAGIFVGLWAPTFLNLGLYFKQLRPSRGS